MGREARLHKSKEFAEAHNFIKQPPGPKVAKPGFTDVLNNLYHQRREMGVRRTAVKNKKLIRSALRAHWKKERLAQSMRKRRLDKQEKNDVVESAGSVKANVGGVHDMGGDGSDVGEGRPVGEGEAGTGTTR